jgi:hypothetical protein
MRGIPVVGQHILVAHRTRHYGDGVNCGYKTEFTDAVVTKIGRKYFYYRDAELHDWSEDKCELESMRRSHIYEDKIEYEDRLEHDKLWLECRRSMEYCFEQYNLPLERLKDFHSWLLHYGIIKTKTKD